MSVFKSWSQLKAVMVSASRKKLSSKVTVSSRDKNPSPIDKMKDSFKNTFPLDRKKTFPGRSLWNNILKMVCTSPKTRFHYLKWSIRWKIRFRSSGKKIKENSFHEQENFFLLKLLPHNFNNGFQHQKKKLWTKAYCFH